MTSFHETRRCLSAVSNTLSLEYYNNTYYKFTWIHLVYSIKFVMNAYVQHIVLL